MSDSWRHYGESLDRGKKEIPQRDDPELEVKTVKPRKILTLKDLQSWKQKQKPEEGR